MDHELDATFDAMSVAFANLVEDCVNYTIHMFFAYLDYCLDHLMSDLRIIRLNFILLSFFCVNGSATVCDYNYVNDLLYESHVWINLRLVRNGFLGDLCKRFTVHLFLLGCNALLCLFFLLSNTCLVFCHVLLAAHLAPTLALTWPEIVLPTMATSTSDGNCRHTRRNFCDLDLTTVLFSLSLYSFDNFDAVVANLMLLVSKLPESNLAAMAWSLALGSSLDGLLLSSIFNCVPENCSWIDRVFFSGAAFFICCLIIFSGHFSAVLALLLPLFLRLDVRDCHTLCLWLAWTLGNVDTNLCEEGINIVRPPAPLNLSLSMVIISIMMRILRIVFFSNHGIITASFTAFISSGCGCALRRCRLRICLSAESLPNRE